MPAFEAPVYTLKGIKIRFGSKQLFEDVELYINRGDQISLVGRNGSGKSTLLKIIAGIIEPDDGEIFIQPNVKIGYMPQDADLSGFKTLREAVAAGLDKHDGSEDYKTDMWIEQLEIAADADPATASGGERRKATLARALIEEPDILLLDEPSSSLDPAHAHAAMRAAKDLCKRGAAVISILHDPNLAAAYATKIALLKDAKLVSFDIPEISLDETLLSKTYSAPCKTLDFDGKKIIYFPEH